MPARKTSRGQEKRRVVNRQVRSSTRTAVKKAARLLDAKTDATAEVLHAVSALDRAGTKGILHRNTIARSKSRLMKRLNAAAAE